MGAGPQEKLCSRGFARDLLQGRYGVAAMHVEQALGGREQRRPRLSGRDPTRQSCGLNLIQDAVEGRVRCPASALAQDKIRQRPPRRVLVHMNHSRRHGGARLDVVSRPPLMLVPELIDADTVANQR